jgi:hypothetical protein
VGTAQVCWLERVGEVEGKVDRHQRAIAGRAAQPRSCLATFSLAFGRTGELQPRYKS